MDKKIAIIFGGKSAEFDVSLISASNIYSAIDKDKFKVLLIGIDKNGKWFYNNNFNNEDFITTPQSFFKKAIPIIIESRENKNYILNIINYEIVEDFDVAFSIIHGAFGEDGTLQGYFKALNIPFVGPDVLGSAICMDKEITKRLLRDNGVPIANFITLRKYQKEEISFEKVKGEFGIPFFVKPCNAGSSIGVSKVSNQETFLYAVEDAFKYDFKILIEEAIIGKEIECAIIGNENPKASVVGEIIPTKDFYSYDAKYNNIEGSKMKIPADIDKDTENKLRKTAIKAFETVECEGMARVDFFLRSDNSFVLNEINTLPGFTQISMYPKLWEQTGLSYSDLITELIELALKRNIRNNKLIN